MTHMNQTQYKGIIIEESLENRDLLKDAQIIKSTISSDGEWNMHTVLVSPEYLERLAQNLKDGKWYAHFWNDRDVIAVFKGKTFKFNFDDRSTWEETLAHGRFLGIPEEQLDFPIDPST
jgi:hypothetical protein